MASDNKALSWDQFLKSGFDSSGYSFPESDDICVAVIACKRWDKHQNLIVYLDCDDGRKLTTSAWQNTNYYGLADIPVGARVQCTFRSSASGKCYLRGVELL